MGRRVVTFRATEAEYALWREQAEAEDLTFTDWARWKLNGRRDVDEPVLTYHIAAPSIKRGSGECLSRVPKGAFCKQCGRIHG